MQRNRVIRLTWPQLFTVDVKLQTTTTSIISAIIAVVLFFAHLSKMFNDELIVLAGFPRPWLSVVRSVLTSSPRKTLS